MKQGRGLEGGDDARVAVKRTCHLLCPHGFPSAAMTFVTPRVPLKPASFAKAARKQSSVCDAQSCHSSQQSSLLFPLSKTGKQNTFLFWKYACTPDFLLPVSCSAALLFQGQMEARYGNFWVINEDRALLVPSRHSKHLLQVRPTLRMHETMTHRCWLNLSISAFFFSCLERSRLAAL